MLVRVERRFVRLWRRRKGRGRWYVSDTGGNGERWSLGMSIFSGRSWKRGRLSGIDRRLGRFGNETCRGWLSRTGWVSGSGRVGLGGGMLTFLCLLLVSYDVVASGGGMGREFTMENTFAIGNFIGKLCGVEGTVEDGSHDGAFTAGIGILLFLCSLRRFRVCIWRRWSFG